MIIIWLIATVSAWHKACSDNNDCAGELFWQNYCCYSKEMNAECMMWCDYDDENPTDDNSAEVGIMAFQVATGRDPSHDLHCMAR